MSQSVPPPGAPGVIMCVPPEMPLIETSARTPPLVAGSMEMELVTWGAPCGVCSHVPPLAAMIWTP